MLYKSPPEDFDPKLEIVSCFLEYQHRFLLLLRNPSKPQGSTWGIPAGKIDPGESRLEAISRELFQETGVKLPSEDFEYFSTYYVRYPGYDFTFHVYHAKLGYLPVVKLNEKEHAQLRWASPMQSLGLPLIQDLDTCVRDFYGI